MNLRQMEVFHAIMRSGSVTGAAKLLNVTQPAVSTMLRHCEDQLKIKLFERHGSRIRPTAEAEAIYPDIANIFERVDTVSRVVNDLAGGRLGQITVASTFSVANGPLAIAISEFQSRNPDVRIAVHALPSAQVIERVARREVDFGFVFGPVKDAAVETEPLRTGEIACILRADSPLAEHEVLTVDLLADTPVISYAPHTPIGSQVEKAFANYDQPLRRSIQVNYSTTAFNLAEAGAGIALVEPMLFRQDRNPHLVVRRFLPTCTVQTCLVVPVGHSILRTAGQFIELARRHIVESFHFEV